MLLKKIYLSLYAQVILSILLGMLVGHLYPELGVDMKPLGDAFVKSIKMLISPIVFCTIVVGIAGMDSMRKFGKTIGYSFLYFFLVSSFALILGLFAADLFMSGAGMNILPKDLNTKDISDFLTPGKIGTLSLFLLSLIPATIFDAFSRGDMLQVIFIAILSGVVLYRYSGDGSLIFEFIEKSNHLLMDIVQIVMYFAPIGAFGAMAFTIGKHGFASLVPLGNLILVFYITCLFFVFIFLGLIAKLSGFSIWSFLCYIKEELGIVLGTNTSQSVLPMLMQKIERLGVRKSSLGIVIPLGYSFNLSGTAIYLTMASIFIAQATNTNITPSDQVTLFLVFSITSKAVTGVPGAGFIILAATLSSVGTIPTAGLAIIFAVDRFIDEARSLVNLISNGVASLAISRLTGDLDEEQIRSTLK